MGLSRPRRGARNGAAAARFEMIEQATLVGASYVREKQVHLCCCRPHFAGHMGHTATPVAPRPAAPRRKPGITTLLHLLPERSLEGSFLCRLPTSTTRASQRPT